MINLPNQQELSELQEFKEPFCLTIYVPFIDTDGATNPNRIELKNLLREAEVALTSAGAKQLDVRGTLKPAEQLLESKEFWPVRRESMVLFMHPKLFRYYHIPSHAAPYILTVETGFNLDPLLEVMNDNQQYYILALSHKNVRLLEGDHYGLRPAQLADFPMGMKETLGIDEYPKSRETHTIAPASMGKGSEAYHEQYNVSQTDKDMLLAFFRKVDQRLHSLLTDHERPLIVAGVKYLLPIYKKANTYPGLLTAMIPGNQDHADSNELREKAWNLVKELES